MDPSFPDDKTRAQFTEKFPFPWRRHNTRILAHNGATVANLPVDTDVATNSLGSFTDQLDSVLARGAFILAACEVNPEDVYTKIGKRSMLERRNDFLETRVKALEGHMDQLVAHWDSVIAAEGGEFNNGAFDSVKDVLHDAREALTTHRQSPKAGAPSLGLGLTQAPDRS